MNHRMPTADRHCPSILLSLALAACTLAAATQCRADDDTPRWYKGNTHTHSFWSDGDDFPDMIAHWYKQQGYHFLALSDHNTLSDRERWIDAEKANRRSKNRDVVSRYIKTLGEDWVEQREHEGKKEVRLKTFSEMQKRFNEDERFLMIQAEEITDQFQRHGVHINAVNLEKVIRPTRGTSTRDTMRNNLRQVIEQEKEIGRPIFAHLNHPNFRWSITAEDMAHVLEEDFFEVYNGHPGINHLGAEYRPGDERLWDIANTIRLGELKAPPLFGVGTDDSHNYHGGNVSPGKGWIMVRAKTLHAGELINAMRKGDFYASSGVTLKDIRFDRKTKLLTIEIEPDGDATFTTKFIGTLEDYDKESKPSIDKSGKETPFTRVYSDDVGKVLAEKQGLKISYQLTGKELFVRATITSSKPPVNPSYEGQFKQAWTQPVGWAKHVKKVGPTRLHVHGKGE